MKLLLIIASVLLMIAFAIATPASIVYAIYLFGAQNVALGAALWGGALLWLKFAVGGIIGIIIWLFVGIE